MILRKGTVVDVEGESWSEGDLRISDGRIVEIAPHVAHRGEGEEEIDARGCLILPGFVQPHVHLCQTLFRGAGDDMELLPWLAERIWPLEAWLDADAMSASADLGLYELVAGGTTAILDMGSRRHTEVLFERARLAGIRYDGGKCLMDLDRSGLMPPELLEGEESALEEVRDLIRRFHGSEGDRLRVSLAPRFAPSCSDGLMRAAGDLACEHGLILHSHAAENEEEVRLVREATGRDNVDWLSDMGALGSQTVLAHGVHLSEEEVNLLFGTGTHLVHCPSSNLKLASGFCRVPELLDFGINVALAADGAPCNNRLSAFREMHLAAVIHKPGRGPSVLPAWRVLAMATINGARALGLEDEIGSLEVGKRADVVVLDPRGPETFGLGDPASAVVYACGPEQVRDVIVDGRLLKRDFEVLTIDAEELVGRAGIERERLRRDHPEILA